METTRRTFLKDAAVIGGAVTVASYFGESLSEALQSAPDWKKQVGLELFTVRDQMNSPAAYESTLAKVAEIGYREVEPAGGYNNLEPKAFRAMLDKYGLSMPSTHSGASGENQAAVEKVLEGFQIMGLKYTGVNIGAGRGGAARAAGPAPAPPAGQAQEAGPGGRGPGAGGRGGQGGRGAAPQPPQSVESVKQQAARLNEMGKIAQKFGMKILVHNHTQEFNLLDDGKTMQHDVIVQNTDPALVAMQLDIGWASVAGQDVIGLFRKYPGRYELWHVKDAWGLKFVDPKLPAGQRMGVPMLVPVGLGEVDYKAIFANAQLAGMKHFCVEQDNASAWGDSVAASRVSFQNLTTKVLA